MKINKIEIQTTFYLLTFAFFILNIKYFNIISILTGGLLSFILIKLNEKIHLEKYKLFNFGIFIINIYFLILYLNKITNYINNNILKNYSHIFISLTLLISSLFIIKKGYHTIVKIILLSSYFLILTFLIGTFFSCFYIDLNNFNINIFYFNNLILESISYGLGIFYLYYLIYLSTKTKFKSKDLVITILSHIITLLFIYSILGLTLTNLYEYPYLIIYQKINLINFIERIEIFMALNYLFCFYYLYLWIFNNLYMYLENKIKKKKSLYFLLGITSLIFFINLFAK